MDGGGLVKESINNEILKPREIISKKLCFVIPSITAGGMERVMLELAIYFADQKLDVHLIILDKGESFYQLNSKIIVHKPDFFFNRRWRLYFTFKTILFLRNKLKNIRPYSVLSFGEMYNSFVLLSALGLKLRIYVSDRSQPDKKWGFFHELLRRLLYPKAAGIISQTSYSKEFLTNITKHQNIRVIPNPVITVETCNNIRKNIVLFIGRLVSTKRVDILLELFTKSNHNGWELWIVGDGPQRAFLEELSKNLELNNSVKFWGNQSDIAKFYLQAKIFAFTSVSEGFPNALLEAMSWGLGCISFDCKSGPSDLIKDNYNGFLIPLLNTNEFLLKLNLLQRDENLLIRLSKNAFLSSKQYSLDKIGQEYLKFITS